jgi:hypothetical protein
MDIATIRISSAVELDTLVGQHVTGEEPEVFWEDSHGQFQFESEAEARRALMDPYYQRFLPDVDWSQTVIREVRAYRPYCADPAYIWTVVEKASAQWGTMLMSREQGRWRVAFGSRPPAHARTAPVAICLAALPAADLRVEANHDRIDAQISQYALQMQQRLEAGQSDQTI